MPCTHDPPHCLPTISNLNVPFCLVSSRCLTTLFPASGMVPVGLLSCKKESLCHTSWSHEWVTRVGHTSWSRLPSCLVYLWGLIVEEQVSSEHKPAAMPGVDPASSLAEPARLASLRRNIPVCTNMATVYIAIKCCKCGDTPSNPHTCHAKTYNIQYQLVPYMHAPSPTHYPQVYIHIHTHTHTHTHTKK